MKLLTSSVQFSLFHSTDPVHGHKEHGYGDRVRIKNLKTIYIRTYCTAASLEGKNSLSQLYMLI
jgi:hypothetical protein